MWDEIDKREYEEQPWRIRNLIPKNGSTILASISGERKTWVALEMARSIAQGVNFLEHEGFSVEPGNVLFINAENAWNEIQRRGRQLGFNAPVGSSVRTNV
jgi:RecA-family ATPase